MLSEKNSFSKKQYGFFTTLAEHPTPRVWEKTQEKPEFFPNPFPNEKEWNSCACLYFTNKFELGNITNMQIATYSAF